MCSRKVPRSRATMVSIRGLMLVQLCMLLLRALSCASATPVFDLPRELVSDVNKPPFPILTIVAMGNRKADTRRNLRLATATYTQHRMEAAVSRASFRAQAQEELAQQAKTLATLPLMH